MVDRPITLLPGPLAALIDADLFAVVDTLTGITKQVTYQTVRSRAHACFSDSNTKTVASTAVAYPITFSTNEEIEGGITHVAGASEIFVPVTGSYKIDVSALIDTTTPTAVLFDLWVRVDGVDVPRSNTQCGIQSAGAQIVLAVPLIINMNAGSYFELIYHGSQTNVRILAVPAQVGPPIVPACPSIIISVVKI